MTVLRRGFPAGLSACLAAALAAAGLTAMGGPAATASAAGPPTVNLKILLIGEGSADPTTAAWQAALTSEGVPYTLVTASGSAPNETVNLPALSSGGTGNFNGVVIADSPADYAAGQLAALDSYESSFGVRQVDGYMFPSPALGVTDVTGGPLDGTTGTLTQAGLTAFPELKGPVPFDVGSYGYGATVDAGAPYTPFLTDAAGHVMAGVYQHPDSDPQAGVAELALNFDYNTSQTQWLLLAPALINWVTQDTHLGLYRNYFGQDIDDLFIADNEWSRQFQCTPAATDPPDYTCPPGVANNPADTPPDVQMSAADVAYVDAWEKQTGIRLELAFNGLGACSADTVADESSANCTGSATDSGVTYTDPGQNVDPGNPDDGAFVNALLADQGDFNWITHTWSHLFLGCVVWQPQPLTSVTSNLLGGSLAAGIYSYEITAATAYGESEPSTPQKAIVLPFGSVTLTWPEAANGFSTDGGSSGPSLAQEEASHTGGTGFWGYNIYREDPGIRQLRAGGPGAGESVGHVRHDLQLHRHRRHPGCGAELGPRLPDGHQPRHRLRQRARRLAAGQQQHARLVDRPGDRARPGVRGRQRAHELLPGRRRDGRALRGGEPQHAVGPERDGRDHVRPGCLQAAAAVLARRRARRAALPEQHLLQRVELAGRG